MRNRKASCYPVPGAGYSKERNKTATACEMVQMVLLQQPEQQEDKRIQPKVFTGPETKIRAFLPSSSQQPRTQLPEPLTSPRPLSDPW